MQWIIAIVVAFVAWRLYVRVRKQFVAQPLRPRKHIRRIVLLLVSGTVLARMFVHEAADGWALGGAAVLGLLLGAIGAKLATVTPAAEGSEATYTPNVWIGATLTALLLGRVAYRLGKLAFGDGIAAAQADALPRGVDLMQRSPWTLALIGLLIGYNVALQAGLVVRGRRLGTATDDKPSAHG
ncbi:MAG: hypothetical protein H6747_11115 [Deltaproteobacteria bacterium]|nr:hypothetical protein [Deltaproteobacteria bacterium]